MSTDMNNYDSNNDQLHYPTTTTTATTTVNAVALYPLLPTCEQSPTSPRPKVKMEQALHFEQKQRYHNTHVKNAQPKVDSSTPRVYILAREAKRKRRGLMSLAPIDRQKTIDHENMILLRKLHNIYSNDKPCWVEDKLDVTPRVYSHTKSMNIRNRQRTFNKIVKENQILHTKIQQAKLAPSHYSQKKMQQSQVQHDQMLSKLSRFTHQKKKSNTLEAWQSEKQPLTVRSNYSQSYEKNKAVSSPKHRHQTRHAFDDNDADELDMILQIQALQMHQQQQQYQLQQLQQQQQEQQQSTTNSLEAYLSAPFVLQDNPPLSTSPRSARTYFQSSQHHQQRQQQYDHTDEMSETIQTLNDLSLTHHTD